MNKQDQNNASYWRQMFSFTKDGKLQSLDLMYSFFLSVGVFFVQFLISNGITMLVERLFPAWSRGAKNAADILLPVLLSMLLALILFRLIRKKSIVTVAYVIAFLLVGILILYMACTYDAETGSVMIAPLSSAQITVPHPMPTKLPTPKNTNDRMMPTTQLTQS